MSSYIYYYGLKANLPFGLLRGAAGMLDVASQMKSYLQRRDLARRMPEPSAKIRGESGHLLFKPGDFPALDRLVPIAQGVYERNRAREETERAAAGKSPVTHLFDFATPEEVRAIVHEATDAQIAAVMCDYFGIVPRFDNADIWVSRPNAGAVGSQLFHLDKPDRRYTSIFLNIMDVTADNGPLTILNATDSRVVRAATSYERIYYQRDGRLADAELAKSCPPEKLLEITGPAGAGGIVDTSECLHCGSRVREGVRVVLILSYMYAHKPGSRRFAGHAENYPEDRMRRLLLGGA